MNEDFEHRKQGELLKLGLAEAKDAQKHLESSVRILSAVADYYQRRKKQTGRVRRAPQSRQVGCQSGLEGAGLKNSGRLDSRQGSFQN